MTGMTMDRRKAFQVKRGCDVYYEFRVMAFKCRVCLEKCEIGEEVVKAIDKSELDEFHRKIDEE